MARSFNGTSDNIKLSLGNANQILSGMTVATIAKAGADGATKWLFWAGTATGNRYGVALNASNVINFQITGTNRTGATAVTVASGWVFVGVTKATGTTTPRAHIYNFGTRTWVHENLSGTLADPAAPASGLVIGASNFTTPTQFWNGDIAAVGLWETALTDAQTESIVHDLALWQSISNSRGIWVLDQAATGTLTWDLTGGGANESTLTGTTVATSAAPWNRGAGIIYVSRQAATADTRVPYATPYPQLLAH